MDILNGETDNYDGVTVTMDEPMDAEVFTHRLRASLSHWREQVLPPTTTTFFDYAKMSFLFLKFGRGRRGFG